MKYFIAIVILSVSLMACESENEEDLFSPLTTDPIQMPMDTTSSDTTTTDTTGNQLTVSFARDVQPIISANCATSGCHVSGVQFPSLETYADISSRRNRVNARITANTMPPGRPLSRSAKDIISAWIAEGATNN
mgnify:CR=1 FL=1